KAQRRRRPCLVRRRPERPGREGACLGAPPSGPRARPRPCECRSSLRSAVARTTSLQLSDPRRKVTFRHIVPQSCRTAKLIYDGLADKGLEPCLISPRLPIALREHYGNQLFPRIDEETRGGPAQPPQVAGRSWHRRHAGARADGEAEPE